MPALFFFLFLIRSSALFFISAAITGTSLLLLLVCDLLWLIYNIYMFVKLTIHPLPSVAIKYVSIALKKQFQKPVISCG